MVIPLQGTTERGETLLSTQEGPILDAVARELGGAWLYDHFYGFSHPTAAYLECWTTLTWLAARYPNLLVGSVVLGVGYRNPALVAKMGATLQTLSGGRFVLGIGAGWREEEYHAYGYPFPRAAARIQQVEEAVSIIHLMWTETAASFEGEYFKVDNAFCPPAPDPRPPMMIGGEGEQLMLPLVGRLADWWNCGNQESLESFRRKRDIVLRSAEEAGRDPGEIRLTYQVSDRPWPRSSADSRAWVEFLSPIVELGFSYFMLDCGPAESPEVIERFASQVARELE